MGDNPEQFAQAAGKLVAAGFDAIDLNFACPVKKVLGRCRGGYLMSQPAAALAIVARVRDALPPHVPLTIKLRRGMDDSSESRDRFWAIFDGSLALGAAAVTVHGRTVRQRYEGPSSWDFLREVKQHAGERVVLGSGDLFTAQDCLDMLARTGVDGVSIARGAIGNPWIFQQVRALAAGQPRGAARFGPAAGGHRRALPSGRGTLRSAARLQPDAEVRHQVRPLAPAGEQVRDAFVAVGGPADFHAVLERWYGTAAESDHRDLPEGYQRPSQFPGSLIGEKCRLSVARYSEESSVLCAPPSPIWFSTTFGFRGVFW